MRRIRFLGQVVVTGLRWARSFVDQLLLLLGVVLLTAGVAVGGVFLHRPAPILGALVGIAVLAILGEGAYRVWRKADDEASTTRSELEAMRSRTLALTISSLNVGGLGPNNKAHLQLWVKVLNLGAPTILHDWQLKVCIGDG